MNEITKFKYLNLNPERVKDQSRLSVGNLSFVLLPTGSEELEVFGAGSIPVAILPSCQDMKTIAL